MNFKLVIRITGSTLLVEAASLLLPLFVALFYHEDPFPFLQAIAIIVPVARVGDASLFDFFLSSAKR